MRANLILVAAFAGVFLTAARAAPPRVDVLTDDGGNQLIVPAAAPMGPAEPLEHDDGYRFPGRFLLVGEYHYVCQLECDGRDGLLYITPDPEIVQRLPHWGGERLQTPRDIEVIVDGADRLVAALMTRRMRADVLAGRLDGVGGRVAIEVEDFTATLECDHPTYAVTFVALVQPLRTASASAGATGC